MQNSDLALERLARLCISLESERALNDDPKWSGKIIIEQKKRFLYFYDESRFALCSG
jgi:hypothetical protein